MDRWSNSGESSQRREESEEKESEEKEAEEKEAAERIPRCAMFFSNVFWLWRIEK